MMASLSTTTGITIDYASFTVFALVMSFLILVGYWLLCKFPVSRGRLSAQGCKRRFRDG